MDGEKESEGMENEKLELEKMLPEKMELNLEDVYREMPLNDDVQCGYWFLKGQYLQKFANKKVFISIYGIMGCVMNAGYAYFNGTITTLEKRFKISSRTTGIITIGNDISQLMVSMALSYYANKGHRPRWISFGVYTTVFYCLLTALPQALYGSGLDALSLTVEYGSTNQTNKTEYPVDIQQDKLCNNETDTGCFIEQGSIAPQIILFVANFISGIGSTLYYTLGTSYIDDNVKKSKIPAIMSFSYFLRLFGPALGYGLASFCLKLYISPNLTPTINNLDQRWIGAWWLGWIILGMSLSIFAFVVSLFPRSLPRAAARKYYQKEKLKLNNEPVETESEVSWSDLLLTLKRLFKNPTLIFNNISAVFYFLGYMPYWIFLPKYIEIQYKQSAAVANFVTGSVGMVFSALGILISGYIISKYKPRARYLAAWNFFEGLLSVVLLLVYVFLGCEENDKTLEELLNKNVDVVNSCSSNCHCDYVKYSPVCSSTGHTFISACHAGCRDTFVFANGTKIFANCSCVASSLTNFGSLENITLNTTLEHLGETAIPGVCPANCQNVFYVFIFVMCIIKLFGYSSLTSNFLISIRCIEEKDKAVSMGLGLMIISLCAFIPSPILFGFIIDQTCIVWGKTCSGTGNCWLYNGKKLRYTMNIVASIFVTIGALFDGGVWYYVKNLKIFDEEVEQSPKDNEK